jgi:hypothetical protein
MPLPHFLQIGGVAFMVLTVFPSQTGVSPEISNAGAAADMAKPRYLGIRTYSNGLAALKANEICPGILN